MVVASADKERALQLVDGHPRGLAEEIDVQRDRERLVELIANSQIVVSLLPYIFHVQVAWLCLEKRTHLVTTSYVSPAMQALNEQAKASGILLLNEIGLDPGIDHMSAMKTLQQIKEQGGRILAFTSCCGGLPAPEAANNPLQYKFSWSPRGVLLAGRNAAQYLRYGEMVRIPAGELFNHMEKKEVPGLGELEVYPNRDSLHYQQLYGLGEAHTVFRGTLRYPGWCATMNAIIQLGLLDDRLEKGLANKTWRQIGREKWTMSEDAQPEEMAAKLQLDPDSAVFQRLLWLDLFSDEPVAADSLLGGLCRLMERKMAYRPGERDLVVLQHDFLIDFGDQGCRQKTSCLIDFGIPHGDSSMSRTVGLPAAIATKLIVQKKIRLTGVQIPILAEIYSPVLAELETMGITFKESEIPVLRA